MGGSQLTKSYDFVSSQGVLVCSLDLSQLRSGKSLAAVAKAEGKSVSGLESAMLAAATSEINTSSGLSAAQKKEMLSELKSHLNAIVTGTRPSGPGPGMGGGMGVPAADAGPMMGGMQGM